MEYFQVHFRQLRMTFFSQNYGDRNKIHNFAKGKVIYKYKNDKL